MPNHSGAVTQVYLCEQCMKLILQSHLGIPGWYEYHCHILPMGMYYPVYCITHYCKRYYHSLWSCITQQKSGMIRIDGNSSRPIRIAWRVHSQPLASEITGRGFGTCPIFWGFWTSLSSICCRLYPLWLFNIAMENGPFIDGLPINSMVDLSMAMWQITSSNQMVPIPEEHSQFAHHFCKNTSDFWDFLAFFLIAEGYVQWEFQDPKMEVR